jgi:hypothetical protein
MELDLDLYPSLKIYLAHTLKMDLEPTVVWN